MHKEKVNCPWTILVHVFQSPKGQAAPAKFESKDCTIQVTIPSVACYIYFEKLSMDGDTRSRAIQSESKILHAFRINDKKFHSRADYLAAYRKQFNEWVRLKERKLDIDAYKSTFFTTIYPDTEFSIAAAKIPFSNKWAEEEQLDPVDATNKFFDTLRLTADILDSIDDGKKSGKTTRRANAHFTDEASPGSPSVDESSQGSVSDPSDEDLSNMAPNLREELLSF